MSEIKPETIIKYSSYTPAQAKATRKYRESHKELVNEQRRKYYLERKERDPQFVEYKRIKAREYYARKMALKNAVVPDANNPGGYKLGDKVYKTENGKTIIMELQRVKDGKVDWVVVPAPAAK